MKLVDVPAELIRVGLQSCECIGRFRSIFSWRACAPHRKWYVFEVTAFPLKSWC